MTARGPGGRIPPDNRPARAPGVGKRAKRHDLERRAVPTLHDSDLQQGDVSMYQQGISAAGLPRKPRIQPPAAPTAPGTPNVGSQPTTGASMSIPDPIDFFGERAGGTLTAPSGVNMTEIDVSPWTPLVQRIANNPNAGGTLQQAFLRQAHNLMARPLVPDVSSVNLFDLDDAVDQFLTDEGF